MGGELQKNAEAILRKTDVLIQTVKARGGHKYRERIRLPNQEIEGFIDSAEAKLQAMAVSLTVAEAMLQETKPAYQAYRSRWDEYVRRRAECIEQLGR